MFTIILTFLPSLAIVFFVIKSDKFKEPIKLIVEAFILGCLICFPAGLLNNLLIWSTDDPEFFSFFAGLTEESLKFLALSIFIRPKSEFNEPMDAVVYGTLISLGFATFENYEYVYVYFDNVPPLEIAIVRALTAIPLHASCGIIMGCFLGMHVFRNSDFAIFKALSTSFIESACKSEISLCVIFSSSTTVLIFNSLAVSIFLLVGLSPAIK